MNFVSMKVD